jgi:hypothetical protein
MDIIIRWAIAAFIISAAIYTVYEMKKAMDEQIKRDSDEFNANHGPDKDKDDDDDFYGTDGLAMGV